MHCHTSGLSALVLSSAYGYEWSMPCRPFVCYHKSCLFLAILAIQQLSASGFICMIISAMQALQMAPVLFAGVSAMQVILKLLIGKGGRELLSSRTRWGYHALHFAAACAFGDLALKIIGPTLQASYIQYINMIWGLGVPKLYVKVGQEITTAPSSKTRAFGCADFAEMLNDRTAVVQAAV